MTTCTVSGLVYAPDGTPLQNTPVVFRGADVVPEYDKVTVPVSVTVTTDETGALEVDLYPGSYRCMARASAAAYQFSIAVPNQATADLEDLIDGMVLYVGIPVLNAFAQLGNSTGAQQVLGSVGVGGYAWKTFDFSDRDAMVAYDASNHNDGDVFRAGDVSHVYETGADVYSDKANLKPLGAIYPDHFGRNATPGTTDMTSAIDAADTYAASVGQPLVFRKGHTYGYDGGTANASWVGGGKVVRNSGQIGSFVTTGASGLLFDVEIDQSSVGNSGNSCFVVAHDDTSTGERFIARDSMFNCVRAVDVDNLRLRGKLIGSPDKALLIKAETRDIEGHDVDVLVDVRSNGTDNNGCVTIKGTHDGTFANERDDLLYVIRSSSFKAICFAEETADWIPGRDHVCFEMIFGSEGCRVDVVSYGGYIGHSINDCAGVQATVATSGAVGVGVEMRNCDASQINAAIMGGDAGIAPDSGLQMSYADHCVVNAAVEAIGGDNINACLFMNESDGCHVTATLNALSGDISRFALLEAVTNARLCLTTTGTAVVTAVTFNDSNCDGIIFDGSKFSTTSYAFTVAGSGTVNDVKLTGGTTFAPTTGIFNAGTPTNMMVSEDSSLGAFEATYFPTEPDTVSFQDFRIGAASQFRAYGDGDPEGAIYGRVGSLWFDTTAGKEYIKTSGTGNSGWSEQFTASGGTIDGTVTFSDTVTFMNATTQWGQTSGGSTNANLRVTWTDGDVSVFARQGSTIKQRLLFSGNNMYFDSEGTILIRDYNSGSPATAVTLNMSSILDLTKAGGELRINGTKVVDSQQDAIADSVGGDEQDKINEILGAMRAHGLIATS